MEGTLPMLCGIYVRNMPNIDRYHMDYCSGNTTVINIMTKKNIDRRKEK
jgi:hypothetical protein